MDVILSESSDLIDGYLTTQVIQVDDATPGLKVSFAVYMEHNSNTQPQHIDTIIQNFLNRLKLIQIQLYRPIAQYFVSFLQCVIIFYINIIIDLICRLDNKALRCTTTSCATKQLKYTTIKNVNSETYQCSKQF